MNEQPHRIPSLDGLRAVSIVFVIISHLVGTHGFPIQTPMPVVFQLGELGVRVFFVISGFLITNLLLQERAKTGRINLINFYIRRTFRIFPPYYTLLFVLIAIQALGYIQLAPGDELHALTYTSNYAPHRSWYIGHTWSLSVEEQFYLLWPALLLLAGTRKGLIAAGALIFLCPVIRLVEWQFFPSLQSGIGVSFESVADSLAAGCVLAGSSGWLRQRAWYRRVMSSPFFVLVPLIVVAATQLHDRPRLSFFFGYTIMNIGIAACVEWCVVHPEGRIGKVLNWGPIVFVGVMSYSIYLWQQLFLNRDSLSITSSFPISLLCTAVAALISYYVVERPSLRLRRQVERRRRARSEAPSSTPVPATAEPGKAP